MSAVRPSKIEDVDRTPLVARVGELEAIRLELVDHTPWEPVWDELVRRYHYLGHRRMVGARLKYLAFSRERPIAALGWRAAALKLEVRDCFVGWSTEQKRRYLPCIANNNRFLIFDWVRVPNLGSHLLSRAIGALEHDWRRKYGHRLLLVETFVDARRFRGTVYRAASWIHLGPTKGFTKDGAGYRYHGQPKEVFVYVVEPRFRALIGCRQRAPRLRVRLRPPAPEQQEARRMLAHQNDWHPTILEDNGITPQAIDSLADLLTEFHEHFHQAFARSEQRFYGLVLLRGLLSDLPRKCLERIALRYIGSERVRALQRFLSDSPWDEDRLGSLYRHRLAPHLAAAMPEDGIFTFDSSEFPKKGKESVGVARQYCGRLGKVDNCQSGVYGGYTSARGFALLDCRLFLPEVWFSEEYAERREACRIPDDITFQTKPEIALDLLQTLRAEGLFPARWVACDETFGDNRAFRHGVAAEDLRYFAAISSNTQVWLEEPEVGLPPYKGRGPRPHKERVLTPVLSVEQGAEDAATRWEKVILAEGAKGPILAGVARRRVTISHEGWPDEELWLFLRRGARGKVDYFLSNAPEAMPLSALVRVCTLRWPIEQSFREGKSELGMDHYEHRSWCGWHRFMLYVFIAMLFLWEVRLQFKKNGCNAGFDAGAGAAPGDQRSSTSGAGANHRPGARRVLPASQP